MYATGKVVREELRDRWERGGVVLGNSKILYLRAFVEWRNGGLYIVMHEPSRGDACVWCCSVRRFKE